MNVALIPARGGSKSIPLKNIRPIAGQPLIYWTTKAANDCKYIDRVFIATDSEKIKQTVESFSFQKVVVVGRSESTATDTASTESVMMEFAQKHDFDNIVLIQATSPLLTADDLNRGFDIFSKEDTDSVFSAVRQKRFIWERDGEGYVSPSNYNPFHRPRRQEFEGFLVENGAFFITSKKLLLQSGTRISGRIRTIEMSEESYFEIDEPDDWIIIEALLTRREEIHSGIRS